MDETARIKKTPERQQDWMVEPMQSPRDTPEYGGFVVGGIFILAIVVMAVTLVVAWNLLKAA